MGEHEAAIENFPLALPRLKAESDARLYLVPLSWYATRRRGP
jgi:hypothetical protein